MSSEDQKHFPSLWILLHHCCRKIFRAEISTMVQLENPFLLCFEVSDNVTSILCIFHCILYVVFAFLSSSGDLEIGLRKPSTSQVFGPTVETEINCL